MAAAGRGDMPKRVDALRSRWAACKVIGKDAGWSNDAEPTALAMREGLTTICLYIPSVVHQVSSRVVLLKHTIAQRGASQGVLLQ